MYLGEGNEVCFMRTKETEEKESKRCVFPFTFKGESYNNCTKDHSSNGAEWCATDVNDNGEVVFGEWGDCDRDAISCFVLRSSEKRIQPGRPSPAGNSFTVLQFYSLTSLNVNVAQHRGAAGGNVAKLGTEGNLLSGKSVSEGGRREKKRKFWNG
jgi:hypothetical protein